MSGYFSRKVYDACFQSEFTRQQTTPLHYQLLPESAENSGKCFAPNGPAASRRGEVTTADRVFRVDVESRLFNLDIPDSRCMTGRTLTDKNERLTTLVKGTPAVSFRQCADNLMDPAHSRLDLPVTSMRAYATVDRFGFPIVPPTMTVYHGMDGTDQVGNDRTGINSRLRLKDAIPDTNALRRSLATSRVQVMQ